MRRGRKSVPAARRQGGAALLIFTLVVVIGTLAYLLSGRAPDLSAEARERRTQEALALAREALIGYALRHRDEEASQGRPDRMYGYLPLPDLGSSRNQNVSCTEEGCDANTPTGIGCDANGLYPTLVGRLPWRTLGLPPLRDGHGECLWLIVSSLHLRRHCSSPVLPPMNWDTLGQLDVVTANGGAALASILTSPHERPLAVVFSPGPPLPGQDRSRSATDDVTVCGGNYDARNYLDPASASALIDVTNYLGGTNHASGVTGDSDPTNDPDLPKGLTLQGRVYAAGGNFHAACPGGDCELLANDRGLTLSSDRLFAAIRNHAYFRTDINAMLDRMVNCLRDAPPAAGFAGRIPANACYDASQPPQGYFDHYRELVFLARPTGSLSVNGDTGCSAALLFAGQRGAGQQRVSAAQKNDISNYLEGANAAAFGASDAAFTGEVLFGRSPPQAAWQDIVRCVPSGSLFRTVTSTGLEALGLGQLVSYDSATRTLTLGRANVTLTETGSGNAGVLYGCAWLADVRALSGGLRSYFRFQFQKVGTSVGNNGFVFAIADAEANANDFSSCGAAGSHLGYSGSNGTTPPIAPPKIGIEFDQARNWIVQTGFSPGYSESTDLGAHNPGRKDPCGTSSCGGSAGFNSHVAIVYWGSEGPNPIDGVSRPQDDDNVHGFPTPGSLIGDTRPPPRAHLDPATESGIRFVDLRGHPNDDHPSRLYHVRVEVEPQAAPRRLAPVRVAVAGAVALNAPGAVLDGVSLSPGDRVLLLGQFLPAQNGVWVWHGAATPMTRAPDADSGSELTQAEVSVQAGSRAGSDWRQVSTITNINTDNQAWHPFVRNFSIRVWLEGDPTQSGRIEAMRNTTRSMALQLPDFAPTLSDTPTLFGVRRDDDPCPCASGEVCGTDNFCYRPPLRRIQLGFTNSQRTQDQEVTINDFFTTWLE